MTLSDLRVPEQHYDDPSGLGYLTYRPATLADLVSALRAEGMLVVEKVDEFAGEFALRLLRSSDDGKVTWQRAQVTLLNMLDALAEAQPEWGPDHPSYDEMGQ